MVFMQILKSLDNADSRVDAAVRVFSRVTDPEDWHLVQHSFSPVQQDVIAEQLGASTTQHSASTLTWLWQLDQFFE